MKLETKSLQIVAAYGPGFLGLGFCVDHWRWCDGPASGPAVHIKVFLIVWVVSVILFLPTRTIVGKAK